MPSRWQREYTCSMCAALMTHKPARLRVYNRQLRSMSDLWLFCDDCVTRIRAFVIARTWATLNEGPLT